MSWEINPETGDYVLTGGHFVRDDGLTGRVYLALFTERGSCPGFPDFGSRLHELRQRKSPRRAALEAPDMVREALAELLRIGDIAELDVIAEAQDTGNLPGVAIQITAQDAGQRPYQFQVFQEVG